MAVALRHQQAPMHPRAVQPLRLPSPEPLVERLSLCVVEILLGIRQVESVARWLDEHTYLHLLERAQSAKRIRDALGRKPNANIAVGIHSLRVVQMGDAVEAVTVIATHTRGRAVAMRLEPRDQRWRATSLVVL